MAAAPAQMLSAKGTAKGEVRNEKPTYQVPAAIATISPRSMAASVRSTRSSVAGCIVPLRVPGRAKGVPERCSALGVNNGRINRYARNLWGKFGGGAGFGSG